MCWVWVNNTFMNWCVRCHMHMGCNRCALSGVVGVDDAHLCWVDAGEHQECMNMKQNHNASRGVLQPRSPTCLPCPRLPQRPHMNTPSLSPHLVRQLGLVACHDCCLSQQCQVLHTHSIRCSRQLAGQGAEEGGKHVLVTTPQQGQGPGSMHLHAGGGGRGGGEWVE
jgi:hypothetical protein